MISALAIAYLALHVLARVYECVYAPQAPHDRLASVLLTLWSLVALLAVLQ